METPRKAPPHPWPLLMVPAIGWVLRLALADEAPPPRLEIDRDTVWELASALGLTQLIGARRSDAELSEALGKEISHKLRQAHRLSVGRILWFERLAEEVQSAANDLGAPLVFLKGFGLHLAGLGIEGARPFVDLDVVTAFDRAEDLHSALRTRGFRSPDVMSTEQHLSPLISPGGFCLDIHFQLKDIRLLEDQEVTLDQILDLGLAREISRLSLPMSILETQLFAAHTIAHGLAHHGDRPGSYPLLRMICDLDNLLPGAESWASFHREAQPWIQSTVPREDLAALERLCAFLKAGELPDPLKREDAAARDLLEHFVSGCLDPSYNASLRFAHTKTRLRAERRRGNLAGYLRGKILPSRGELELRYSRPLSGWRVLPWRVWHVVRQAAKLVGWSIASGKG